MIFVGRFRSLYPALEMAVDDDIYGRILQKGIIWKLWKAACREGYFDLGVAG